MPTHGRPIETLSCDALHSFCHTECKPPYNCKDRSMNMFHEHILAAHKQVVRAGLVDEGHHP